MEFRIAVNLEHLIPPDAPFNKDLFPHLAHTVQRLATEAMTRWMAYASGKPLPNGLVIKPRSGTYLRSIQLREYGDFSHEVYSDLVYAAAIEKGSPPRDLKAMLNTSMKVRIIKKGNRKGKRYLIIPFRHGTPGAVGFSSTMSDNIHNIARAMSASRVTREYHRASETGAHDIHTRQPFAVKRREYHWGNRLSEKALLDAGASEQQAQRMRGMVKMQNPTSGGNRDTQYMTFRVMSEDSPGWRTRGTEGRWPARTVAEQIRPLAEEAFSKAAAYDVRRLMGGR